MTDYTTYKEIPWYDYRYGITKIVIADGVTSIGSYAFDNCSNLVDIAIPKGVKTIGSAAFSDCIGLTNIVIPDGVTSLGDFVGCTNLVSITIPDSVTSMGSFRYCTSLTNITIPDGVTSIPAYGFDRCSNLTSVNIPENLTSIGAYTFQATGLTGLVIPDAVTTIGEGAFYNCKNLTSVTFGSSLNTIGPWAFGDCIALTNVTIPDSVEMIDYAAFYRCTGLKDVVLGCGLTTIGGNALSTGAFAYCSGLTNITIPANVTSINASAFTNCSNLTEITFAGQMPPSIVSNAFDYVATTAYYPDVATWTEDMQLNYGGSLTWEPYQTILSSSVTLDSVLGINFTTTDGGNIRVTIDGEEYGVNQEGNLFTVSVFAQDMTKDIVATIYDGEEVVDTKTFNLAAYVQAINEGDYSAEEKALATATLNYCQHAAYVKYATGTQPVLAVVPIDAFAEHTFINSGNARGISVHCYLEEACQLRLRLSSDYKDCTVLIDGTVVELTQVGETYLAASQRILPQDYDTRHTFTVQRDGVTVYEGSFNVLAYLGRCLETGVGSADMQQLLRAMYHYYAAAEEYIA